jgi:hypothetical protein
MRDSLAELTKRSEAVRTNLTSTVEEYQKQVSDYHQESLTVRKNLKEKMDEWTASVDQMTSQATEKLRNLEASILTELKTKTPHKFWQQQRRSHRRWFWFWGPVVLAVGALSVWAVYEIWSKLFEKAQPYPTWQIGFLLFTGTVTLLLLRVLTRIMMSHLHLATDAAERVVMLETYIALTLEGRLDEEHRSLILQALFKPSTTGLIKEEAVPASVLDLATRVAQGTKN